MVNRSIAPVLVCLLLAGSMLLAGCGGGGETVVASSPSGPAAFLTWDPPQTYEDTTPLDPYADLDYYEFYIRPDMNFTDNDLPVAQVAAVEDIWDPDVKTYLENLTTEFDLQNLLPFVSPGETGYLSIRAVGIDGMKSGFSEPIEWNVVS
ncbi:MAG: hypothetical protein R3239_01910 [Thermodesulfobacteriota bacterium]|nr:hypothetical protein [Thermodesulfobacteriota bacterium]